MDTGELLKAIVALLFVLALILLVAWLVRRFGIDKQWRLPSGQPRRMEVIERLTIDPRRQLVLVRHDTKEHLLLLGQHEASVVQTNESKAD